MQLRTELKCDVFEALWAFRSRTPDVTSRNRQSDLAATVAATAEAVQRHHRRLLSDPAGGASAASDELAAKVAATLQPLLAKFQKLFSQCSSCIDCATHVRALSPVRGSHTRMHCTRSRVPHACTQLWAGQHALGELMCQQPLCRSA